VRHHRRRAVRRRQRALGHILRRSSDGAAFG
jgi:hypothetical protein